MLLMVPLLFVLLPEVILLRNKHSRVSEPNSFVTRAGDKFHQMFDSFFSADGTIRLKESGRRDIQAEINSHLAETDMAVIVKRLQMGDTSVLTSKRPMFGDFTQLPSSFAEAYEMVYRSEQVFEALSPEIKQRFDNDRAKWFSSLGTEDWFKNMGIDMPLAPTPGVDLSPDSSEKEVVE